VVEEKSTKNPKFSPQTAQTQTRTAPAEARTCRP
jgi:hypothetical protein